jgi:DivIVA domain-containing protein
MEGTPQLLTDVKFTQLRKGGYDPEEVDNYLERINEAVAKLADNLRSATERAETAQSQLADARRAQSDAEAEVERLRDGGVEADAAAPTDEQVARVLVLAQRAADQAIDEANATASKTLADARAKSVNLLAEAEQERERLLVKAHKKADAVAEERARTLQTQVVELETARDDLQIDVDALQSFLDDERDRLRDRVDAIRHVLDEPEGLRVAEPPELRDPPIPELELDTGREAPSPFVEPGAATDSSARYETDDRPTEAMELLDERLDDPDRLDDDVEMSEAGLDPEPAASGGWSDVIESAGESDDGDDDPFVTPEVGSVDGLDEGGWSEHRTSGTIYLDPHADAAGAPPPPADTDSHLFGGPAEETSALPADSRAELFGADRGDDALGEPDAAADAAMRAFFERDLDDPTGGRSRFGRRR